MTSINDDPRQQECLANYLNPDSETFGNAYQSAIAAGFSDEYARNFTYKRPRWWAEKVGNNYNLARAEKNLTEFLEMNTKIAVHKNDAAFDDPGLCRVKADITKFVLERLNKQKYSVRQELTDGEGQPLKFGELSDEELDQKIKDAVQRCQS